MADLGVALHFLSFASDRKVIHSIQGLLSDLLLELEILYR